MGYVSFREAKCQQKMHPVRNNGWNRQPSPMKRKENDLKQTSKGIMFHVNFQGCSRKQQIAVTFSKVSF